MTYKNKFLGQNWEHGKPKKQIKEGEIEQKACQFASRLGMLAEKFTSPSKRSVPDRMFTCEFGTIFFIEFKAPGKKPTEKQALDHKKRRDRGVHVFVIDDLEKAKLTISYMRQLDAAQNATSRVPSESG